MNFKLLNKLFSSTALLALAGSGFASGFQIWEQDNAGIGDYHAGAAVDTNNTGIEFYNPAGMVFMNDPRPQASGGLTYIPLDVKFDGVVGTGGSIPGAEKLEQHTNGWAQSKTNNFIPNLHIIVPLGNKWAAGFGVTTPFGLSTEYNSTPADFAATKTKLLTINFNPNLAFKATNWLAVGAGIDIEYGAAEFDNDLMYQEFHDTSKLSDVAMGWNAGLYLKPTSSTDIGLAFRSGITHHAKGTNTVTDMQDKNKITAILPLPATLTLSADQHIGSKVTILGSAEFTTWSSFKSLNITNMIDPASKTGTGASDMSNPFNYNDTWNLALGAHYQLTKSLELQAGTGFDWTPTNDKDRDIRLPGTDRVAIAVGANYLLSKHFGIDAGYVHLIPVRDAKINNTGPQISGNTTITQGIAKTEANVFGMQLTAYL